MTGVHGTTTNPALDALGDRLESAASTAVASGGVPPQRPWAKLAIVPLVALFVAAGLVIANVVPGSSGDPAEAAIISAARHTSERSTGRFEATIEAEGLALGGSGPVRLVTTGAYDADQGLYQASLDTSQVLAALPGADALDGVGPTIDAVVAGEVAYLDISPLASLVGAEWLEVTVPELAGDDGLSSVVDPAAVLDTLEAAGADMDEVGREQVRGVDTTHFAGTLSLEEAYEAIPAADRAGFEQALDGVVDLAGLPDVSTDVWVDDDELVRRVVLSVDTSAFGIPGLDEAGALTVSVELFDIGEDVAIELPAADETVTVDDLVPDELLEGLGSLEGLGDLDDLDLDALLEDLEGMVDELDLEGMLDELEERFGRSLPDPTAPSGQPPAEGVPDAPPTTVTD